MCWLIGLRWFSRCGDLCLLMSDAEACLSMLTQSLMCLRLPALVEGIVAGTCWRWLWCACRMRTWACWVLSWLSMLVEADSDSDADVEALVDADIRRWLDCTCACSWWRWLAALWLLIQTLMSMHDADSERWCRCTWRWLRCWCLALVDADSDALCLGCTCCLLLQCACDWSLVLADSEAGSALPDPMLVPLLYSMCHRYRYLLTLPPATAPLPSKIMAIIRFAPRGLDPSTLQESFVYLLEIGVVVLLTWTAAGTWPGVP